MTPTSPLAALIVAITAGPLAAHESLASLEIEGAAIGSLPELFAGLPDLVSAISAVQQADPGVIGQAQT